jgi:hypothetical protein
MLRWRYNNNKISTYIFKSFYKDKVLSKQREEVYNWQRNQLQGVLGKEAYLPVSPSNQVSMLYGESFNRQSAPRPARFSDPKVEVAMEPPKRSILNYKRLSEIKNDTAQVAIHLQARGFGKTKEAFDAALHQERFVFYFDLTQIETKQDTTNNKQASAANAPSIGAKSSTALAYYTEVFEATRKYPAYSEELSRAATNYTLYLFCAAIVHSEILLSSPVSSIIPLRPADILLLSVNGNDRRDIVFQKLLEYDLISVLKYCTSILSNSRYQDVILVIDEIQETMSTNQIGAVFHHRFLNERQGTDQHKTLYHPFVEGLMKFAPGRIVKRKNRSFEYLTF